MVAMEDKKAKTFNRKLEELLSTIGTTDERENLAEIIDKTFNSDFVRH